MPYGAIVTRVQSGHKRGVTGFAHHFTFDLVELGFSGCILMPVLARKTVMVNASELKPGVVVRIEGQVYRVLEVEVKAGTAKLSGVVKAKLRNVESERLWEPHFRLEERLQDFELERRAMEFLFSTGENCTFMDVENFEQIEIPLRLIGPAKDFLQSGMQVPVELFEGRPINVVLPEILEARVASTAEPVHQQQDNAWKEAVLENGVRIRVPLFIGPGEIVRVEVKSGRYLERVRAERRRSA
jgi:elongation factor P